MFCFTDILNIFFSLVTCSMHKNPHQNAGNGIKETLFFKIFLGTMPPAPPKISQLVASLQTSRQQVVFAWLVTSCQQVWNKPLTTCNNLVDIVRLVTRLFQQSCYNHHIIILLQPCVVNLVTFLLYHDCIRLVRTTL